MKVVYLVGDGMADLPMSELDNRTVLEVSFTPNIDFLLANGKGGMLKTVPDGIKPGSDVANMSLMGYSPSKFYTGRSPLEAASIGVEMDENSIIYRANFVTIIDGKMVDFSGGHVQENEARDLIKTLQEKINIENIEFFKGVSYRNIMKTDKTFHHIQTTPPHDIIGQDINKYLPNGENCNILIDLMNEIENIFLEHPVNQKRKNEGKLPITGIWLWGNGTKPNFTKFYERYKLKGVAIAAVDLIKGIAKSIGIDAPHISGTTGYLDTDYRAKSDYLIANWHRYDYFFLHLEAPDEAGHMGSIEEKIKAIEKFDKDIVGKIVDIVKSRKDNVRVVITPDHPTPIALKTHTNDEVPFVIWGKNIKSDNAFTYNEKECSKKGSLHYKTPIELLDDVIFKKQI